MENVKSLFASKTFWFGFMQIILGGYAFFTGLMDQQAAFALVVSGMGTIGLRTVTSQPVSFSGK